ncbi:MAG: aspartate kinase, partial [Myxococcales bacterium]|nr:aspartate kinase [Myxococcales bacterium]
QGMSYKREITTLGRGGTDTTAVALAAALQADRCEIYSDVDGVYSADPRAVADASHLPEVDYATLQEMAASGAKVLCAQALEWARRSGVAIYARSTFDPPAGPHRETVVRRLGPAEQRRARAVTCNAKVALLEVDLTPGPSTLSRLLERLAGAGVPVAELATTKTSATVLLSLLNAPDWRALAGEIAGLPEVSLAEDVALVSVVGDGLTDQSSAVARFGEVLARAGATPRGIFVSALRLAAIVDADRSLEAQQALHAAFIG